MQYIYIFFLINLLTLFHPSNTFSNPLLKATLYGEDGRRQYRQEEANTSVNITHFIEKALSSVSVLIKVGGGADATIASGFIARAKGITTDIIVTNSHVVCSLEKIGHLKKGPITACMLNPFTKNQQCIPLDFLATSASNHDCNFRTVQGQALISVHPDDDIAFLQPRKNISKGMQGYGSIRITSYTENQLISILEGKNPNRPKPILYLVGFNTQKDDISIQASNTDKTFKIIKRQHNEKANLSSNTIFHSADVTKGNSGSLIAISWEDKRNGYRNFEAVAIDEANDINGSNRNVAILFNGEPYKKLLQYINN